MCDDCTESENGQPAQACCPQCLEEQATALADHLELSGALELLNDAKAMEARLKREAIDYKAQIGRLEKRADRWIDKAQAQYNMCSKLSEALYIAHRCMVERREKITTDQMLFVQRMHRYNDEEVLVEAALKEWEDGK